VGFLFYDLLIKWGHEGIDLTILMGAFKDTIGKGNYLRWCFLGYLLACYEAFFICLKEINWKAFLWVNFLLSLALIG
jgi:hypothetical protein